MTYSDRAIFFAPTLSCEGRPGIVLLARAVKGHLDGRVMLNGRKTVVFA